MLRQSNKKRASLRFLPEEGSAGTDCGLVAGEMKMERGPWRAPDPGAGGLRPGLSGPPSPRGGRAATRRAGAGSPGGRRHGPAASHGHGRAAGQYEPGFDSGQARSGSHPRGGVVSEQRSVPGSAGLPRPVTGRWFSVGGKNPLSGDCFGGRAPLLAPDSERRRGESPA